MESARRTNLTDLPPETLAQIVGNELTQIATFRAALPKWLHKSFNEQIHEVLRCFGPTGGMIYKAELTDFPNLRRVQWFNSECMSPLSPNIEYLEYQPKCVIIMNNDAFFDFRMAPRNLVTLKLRCFLNDPNDLADQCPNLLELQFITNVSVLDLHKLKIQKLKIQDRVESAYLPGTITDFNIPYLNMSSVQWTYPPTLVRVSCYLFPQWRQHLGSLRYCDSASADFCLDTKYSSIKNTESVLSFVPEIVKFDDIGSVPYPTDKKIRIVYISTGTLPVDDRIETLHMGQIDFPIFFPTRLKVLSIWHMDIDVHLIKLPATLTQLHVGLFRPEINGVGLCNLLELTVINNRGEIPLRGLLKSFPDSKNLAGIMVSICCDVEKCDDMWDNFPKLNRVVLTTRKRSNPKIRIAGRHILRITEA